MYKVHNYNLSPSYLKQIFTKTANVHAYNLRNSELSYYIPRPGTEFGKTSLQYQGSVLWNRISPFVQNFALRKRLQDLTEWERLLFPDLNMILEIRVSQNLAKLGGE